ncbi:MAG: hypothetical protein JOZ95_07775 [Solirubrobacterales bacterium]|nr:hypothetical protein [Solirubrobacterales bacterium]
MHRDLPITQQIDGPDDALDRLNCRVSEIALDLDAASDPREHALQNLLIARGA